MRARTAIYRPLPLHLVDTEPRRKRVIERPVVVSQPVRRETFYFSKPRVQKVSLARPVPGVLGVAKRERVKHPRCLEAKAERRRQYFKSRASGGARREVRKDRIHKC